MSRNGGCDESKRASDGLSADLRGRAHNLAPLTPRLLAALALACGAAPLSAQPTSAPALSAVSQDFIAGLPKSLLGAKARRFAGSISYFPRQMGGPMVMIGALPTSRTSTYDQLRSSARSAYGQSGLREIVREGNFQAPRWPGALTFFGEYVAGSGRKQVWSLQAVTDSVTVTATYFDPRDSARIEAAIRDVLGGAVLTASKPTE